MTTPAIVPAAMISLVALAAARDRRDGAMAVWLGMALALSGWALLVAAALAPTTIRRSAASKVAAIALLSACGGTLVLRLAGLPHSTAGIGLTPVCVVGILAAIALIVPKLAAPRSLLLTHRIG